MVNLLSGTSGSGDHTIKMEVHTIIEAIPPPTARGLILLLIEIIGRLLIERRFIGGKVSHDVHGGEFSSGDER